MTELLCTINLNKIGDFVKIETAKGKGLCKRTQGELYRCVEMYSRLKNSEEFEKIEKYSSGRKKGCFDDWGIFYTISSEGYKAGKIIFCTQEIDAYAKSYRVTTMLGVPRFAQIFEFKPEKI